MLCFVKCLCCCTLRIRVNNFFSYLAVQFIAQPPDVIRIEGDSVHLEYKLWFNIFPGVFIKNNVILTKEKRITQRRKGRSMILQIDHVTENDGGNYSLKVAGYCSDWTILIVERRLSNT